MGRLSPIGLILLTLAVHLGLLTYGWMVRPFRDDLKYIRIEFVKRSWA